MSGDLKKEIESRSKAQNGEATGTSVESLHDSNNQLKLAALDAQQRILKLQHEKDTLVDTNKQTSESLTRMVSFPFLISFQALIIRYRWINLLNYKTLSMRQRNRKN